MESTKNSSPTRINGFKGTQWPRSKEQILIITMDVVAAFHND